MSIIKNMGCFNAEKLDCIETGDTYQLIEHILLLIYFINILISIK